MMFLQEEDEAGGWREKHSSQHLSIKIRILKFLHVIPNACEESE
jgi:hypothetical protein